MSSKLMRLVRSLDQRLLFVPQYIFSLFSTEMKLLKLTKCIATLKKDPTFLTFFCRHGHITNF